MKNDNIIQRKSYAFSIKIVRLYQYLTQEHKEFVLSKQVLKSGTSIRANVEEAIGGQSERDFIAKLSISYKEARETNYWIRLLFDTDYITREQKEDLENDSEELLRIIGSILKTMSKSKSRFQNHNS